MTVGLSIRSGLLATALGGVPLPILAQAPIESWVRERLTVYEQILSTPDRKYEWAEVSVGREPDTATRETAAVLAIGNRGDFRVASVLPVGRLDQGRSEGVEWDLSGGLLSRYAVPKAAVNGSPHEAQWPISATSRQASLGYCLTGGLHLIDLLDMRHWKVEARDGYWFMIVSSESESMLFRISSSAVSSEFEVVYAEVLDSAVPGRIGNHFLFTWDTVPSAGHVAVRTHSYSRDGKLVFSRSLKSVSDLSAEGASRLCSEPVPGIADPLIGEPAILWRTVFERDDKRVREVWNGKRWVAEDVWYGWRPPQSGIKWIGWAIAILIVLRAVLTWPARASRASTQARTSASWRRVTGKLFVVTSVCAILVLAFRIF